ncbi:protein WVD2-like 7 [Salvia miltiorrhiza]|uniref:protein WVD2-like 7 n=1 Tax=Salvia miltiorrhiza TaxID=226208 RepID=UPI0025AC053B|nr:protein WVD2-like 7 [Salvia miltiorrhiza]
MGDSACLMHGFSYTSAPISNQSKQGNPMRFLGESVSFGRFVSEPLSWEKWSTFSHKKYVEEAARYAQPGSVAEKKAFFEAHYKKLAAQKAAAEAEAAALLEQENDARAQVERLAGENGDDDSKNSSANVIISGNDKKFTVESVDGASCSEGNGTPQIERPLLKGSCVGSEDTSSATSNKKHGLSSLKSSIRRKTWRVPSTPLTPHINNVSQSAKKSSVESMDKRRPSHKSLHGLINLVPIKDPDKELVSVAKKAAANFSTTPKDCRTPIMAAAKGVAKYSASTPRSDNRRMKTPIDPCDNGSKIAAPKWQILSTVYTKSVTACRNKLQSPASSTPFMLRTEERAAKRKQKLEEKFNANEEQKVQLQTTLKEKAGNEIRKLSYSFCFKARPLPDFYKERETSVNPMKKTPTTLPQTAVLGRSNSKKYGIVPMPSPPPPPKSVTKNGASSNKKAANPRKFLTTSMPQRITRENRSPNIQH